MRQSTSVQLRKQGLKRVGVTPTCRSMWTEQFNIAS
nr:MAG TPA: hypothetical protein [Bacteriophage sp.]